MCVHVCVFDVWCIAVFVLCEQDSHLVFDHIRSTEWPLFTVCHYSLMKQQFPGANSTTSPYITKTALIFC